jgi:ribosomal protein L15
MTSAEKKIIDNERDEYNSTLANGRISEKYNLAQTIKNVETSAKEKVYSAESVTLLK